MGIKDCLNSSEAEEERVEMGGRESMGREESDGSEG